MFSQVSDKPQGELGRAPLAGRKIFRVNAILNHRDLIIWDPIRRVLRCEIATRRDESIYLAQRKQDVGIAYRRWQWQTPSQHLSTVEAGETALLADGAAILQESILEAYAPVIVQGHDRGNPSLVALVDHPERQAHDIMEMHDVWGKI